MKQALPTVAELNEIQRRWMALDCSDPEPVKAAVIKAVSTIPRAYLSVDRSLIVAGVIIDGCPMWATRQPIRQAMRWLMELRDNRHHPGVRTDVAWCGELEQWVDISAVMPS